MTEHVKRVMEHNNIEDDHVEKHVDHSLDSLQRYIGNHGSSGEVHSLRNLRLKPEDWEIVQRLVVALADKRMQDVGKAVVHEARTNLLAGPSEIGKNVVNRLRKDHLLSVAQELLPTKLRNALLQKWAKANPNEQEIWKMLLDPTGEKLARIRDNSTSNIIEGSGLLPFDKKPTRSLRQGPWEGPFQLNAGEITLGVMSVIFTTAAEIMLHIDLLMNQWDIPKWLQTMLFVPAIGGETLSCAIANSFWCEFGLAALGLNALDAVAVASGLNLDTDDLGNNQPMGRQPFNGP
jgi:hypothetical protein